MRPKLLVALIVVVLCVSFSVQNIHAQSSQPQILGCYRTPLDPPPGFDVNVTCTITDPYELVNISLYYSINDSSLIQETAQIINGDYFNGTFQGQIPAQQNGTFVTYFINATDSIGYSTQTQNDSYTVSPDIAPPIIVNFEIVNPIGSPVLPTENVTIEALINDDGSGVKNATLFYGPSTNWGDDSDYIGIPMCENNGDIYNCTFDVVIPAQFTNGTRIWYYVEATDFSNNTSQANQFQQFYVAEATNSTMDIDIEITNVDDQTLTATASITINAYLPDDSSPISIQLYNEVTENNQTGIANVYFLQLNASSILNGRFMYSGTWTDYNFYLIGNPNLYPFDHYLLNFTFDVFWSQLQTNSVSIYALNNVTRNNWNIWQSQSNATDGSGHAILVGTEQIARNTNGTVFPLILLVVMLFFVLGGTLLVEPNKLNERLTVYLAIFIFVAGFFFSLDSIIPYSNGFTSIQSLFLYLVIGSGLLIIGSFFSKGVTAFFEDHHFKTTNFLYLKLSRKWLGPIVDYALRFCGLIRRNLGLVVDTSLTLALYFLWIRYVLVDTPAIADAIIVGLFFGIGFRIILKAVSFFARKQLH